VKQLQRIAFVGNSLPRRCGIATFTTDLRKALASLDPDIESCIVAMTDNGRAYDYPAEFRLEIGDQSIEDYGYASTSSASSAVKPATISSRYSTGSACPWSQRCIRSCRNPRALKGLSSTALSPSRRGWWLWPKKAASFCRKSTTCPPRRSR